MNALQPFACLVLSLGLVGSWRVGAEEEPPPRLFPDLAPRYAVGDPEADNPLRDTEGPKALAAGDLNGDGRADVISGNLDGSISVLLGLAEGALADQILHPATGLLTNTSIREVLTADFNQDHRLDVAIADVSGEAVLVFLGQGDGTLQLLGRTAAGPARALDQADFNQDGHIDLVVASSPADCFNCPSPDPTTLTNRSVSILLGTGDGSFQAVQPVLRPALDPFYYDVAAGDVNGDGLPDVLVLENDPFYQWIDPLGFFWYNYQAVLVFLNQGNGVFNADEPDQVLNIQGEGPRAMTLGYVDERLGPGGTPSPGATLDLVVANRDSASLEVFLHQGDSLFGPSTVLPAGDSPRDVAIGDLDEDGWSDLVVVNRNQNTIAILAGQGQGRLSPPILELPTGTSPRNIVLADINGDGALDAVVNNRISEDVSLFLGQAGLKGFLLPDGFYPAGFNPISVVAEDFNGDGYPDVASANLRSHDVRVRLNQGDGSLGPESVYPVSYAPAFLASADVNGDGVVDLVASCMGSPWAADATTGSSLVTLLGTGQGTFGPPISTPLHVTSFKPFWLRLADLSGDHVPDAAVSGANGALLLLQGSGDGRFHANSPLRSWVDGRPLGFALGDFDGNGWLDIATSRGVVLLNDGQFFLPNSDPPEVRTRTFQAGFQAWAVETEDLDGDGLLDLMVALTFRRPDPIGILYGVGDGSFTPPDVYEGPDVGAVALWGTDVTGDGLKDVVVGNRCAATIIIMEGQGDRTFRLREIVMAYSVEDVAVADLNRDDRPDLVGVGFGLWTILNGASSEIRWPRTAEHQFLPERSGLYLNEMMARNVDFHPLNGLTPDWIEIYNHSPNPQVLTDWRLAQFNQTQQLTQWIFPADTVIEPWQYLLVYCVREPIPGQLCATFELSADGETILLLNPAGIVVDEVEFPALPPDVSYARFVDGGRFLVLCPAPTLGSSNLRPANIPPTIERKDPFVGPAGTSLALTARAYDDLAVAYAAVCYRLSPASNSDWIEIPLNDDGQSGDKQAGDGYYGAFLPALPPGAALEYYLRVVDMEGQVDTSPDEPGNESKLHRLPVPQCLPDVRLSELMAQNLSGRRDEAGELEDWIEVVNVGAAPVSLDGLALMKDYFEPQNAWPFPSLPPLASKERLLIFCDNDPEQGPLHATFKIQRDGDRIFLVQTNEPRVILDSLSFNSLPGDTSFGVLDPATLPQMMAWPTPGSPNLAIPQAANPNPDMPHLFCRKLESGQEEPASFVIRWQGKESDACVMAWSEDLAFWHLSPTPPVHLGDGLFEWKQEEPWTNHRFFLPQKISP